MKPCSAWMLDRLGRGSMSQQGVILEAFQHAGVKIITPQKTYDLDNEMDEDYTELQTFFARKELKLIKKRLRRGQERTAAEGGYLASAPFGYEKNARGPASNPARQRGGSPVCAGGI